MCGATQPPKPIRHRQSRRRELAAPCFAINGFNGLLALPLQMPEDEYEDGEGSGEEEVAGDDLLPDEGGRSYTMNFRMYENQFPEIDDLVMVQV